MENTKSPSSCIVLFSGGQDSTTCLYWAKKNFNSVQALNIYYGQRHHRETESADIITKMAGIELKRVSTDIFTKIGDSSLLDRTTDINSTHRSSDNLPASFVPGRNVLLLTIAAMHAFKGGVPNIVTGVCQTDYSGYPDCRNVTIQSLERTLSLGMDFQFRIHTPLMYKTKVQTVRMAKELPGCMKALAYSHTCYEGKYPPCGKCPACVLRAKGFKQAGVKDPLIERAEHENLL